MENSAKSMAAYYQPGAQEDLQSLYLKSQGYTLYGDAPPTAEMHLMSSSALDVPLHPRVFLQPTAPGPEISNFLQAFPSSSHHMLWGSNVAPQLGLLHPQGLSLSLSPQRTAYAPASAGEARAAVTSSASAGSSNGVSCLQSLWVGSKYLKAAQQLLEEVANVGGDNRGVFLRPCVKKNREEERRGFKQAAELPCSERLELQMKKAKLVHMFEDVEKRYKLYHRQMQVVGSSFESAAGIGAARAYTALALKTISRQFRCLRDAIAGQIRTASTCLGDEELFQGEKPSASRLPLIDQQIRQQRALQQIAIMQQNAWRPQRGLPERSVSILRAWLFEHFLHPYPKNSDKQMLAKQTGLTRSQVSNWFINARVRLWKPMVEEMYMEEVKAEAGQNSPSETEQPTVQLPPVRPSHPPTMLKEAPPLAQSFSTANGHGGGFRTYAAGQTAGAGAEQFGTKALGKGVSLTLGLPRSESLSLSRGQPSFLSDDGISLGRTMEPGSGGGDEHSLVRTSKALEDIDVQSMNRLPAQLLRDFVA